MLSNLLSRLNVFGTKDSQSGKSNDFLSKVESKEKVTILSSQINLQFDGDQVKSVLSDFEKLDFKDNKCFNKIADDYEKKGQSSLFNYVILNKRKEIMDILDQKLALSDQEEFRRRFGRYLLQIDGGASYEKKLQNELQFSSHEVEEVLSDFKKLNFNFKGNECKDSSDSVNYNSSWPADPFDKIANYYRENKNIFLFNYVVLSRQKEIMDILDEKLYFKDEDQERLKEKEEKKNKFKERFGRYLLRIDEGMSYGQEFLKTDSAIAFFDGCYVPCPYANRLLNHYDYLNINITKPGQTLETSRLFSEKTKRMERIKNEVERAKIYDNGKRIITIEKNEKQQRDYSFTRFAICDIEISWDAQDGSGKDLGRVIVLSINSGQISIKKSTIEGKSVELKDILELAKQNEVVLIGGKALHEVLEKYLIQQTQCEEKENTQPRENIVVGAPSSTFNEETTVEKGVPSPQQAISN